MTCKEVKEEIARLEEIYIDPEVLGKNVNEMKRIVKKKEGELNKYKKKLKKEVKDVKKLERTSISSLFHKLMGKYDEQLNKEKEEIAVATSTYESCEKEFWHLKEKLEEAVARHEKMLEVKERIEALVTKKMSLMRTSGTPEGRMLVALEQEIRMLEREIKETEEVIIIAEDIFDHLRDAKSNLKAAEGWGVYDLLGGDVIAGIGKHHEIDQARDDLEDAKYRMKDLQRELKDIPVQDGPRINITLIDTFIDFFYDGFLADFYVQTKVSKAIRSIERGLDEMEQLIDNLKERVEDAKETIDEKQYEIEDLVDDY